MKILTVAELEEHRQVIGESDFSKVCEVLEGGGQSWLFLSREEIEESELDEDEKQYCRDRFDDGEQWAGIIRRARPASIYEPGITYSPDYDPHGNPIGNDSHGQQGGCPH